MHASHYARGGCPRGSLVVGRSGNQGVRPASGQATQTSFGFEKHGLSLRRRLRDSGLTMDIIFNDMEEFITPVPGVLMKTEPIAIKCRMARHLGHLDALESEAIRIMREVAAECANPTLLFSGGKDSIVLLRLA